MGPTTPHPAFKLGEKTADPIAMYMEDIFTLSLNLAGLPGMSIPCGNTHGLPIGLQIIGNYFAEAKLLNVAHQFQQATDWHQQAPAGLYHETKSPETKSPETSPETKSPATNSAEAS